ncbi:MAG: hypothetical protein B6I26_04675 [Desulfobacteraceae bacterium 4572_130]|nr:MAG: hypothetical protein B6I26_04675 [Desulfobacteraceae bacterium 4572_130]
MKRKLLGMLIALFLLLSFTTFSFAKDVVTKNTKKNLKQNVEKATETKIDLPKEKQTSLGLYITAKEAFANWYRYQDKVIILDIRTPEEYMLGGHATMAVNIPVKFLKKKIDFKKDKSIMSLNKKFVEKVKKKFKTSDIIMIMGRSGARSAVAVDMLAKAGFTKVYNIIDGFEGDKLNLPISYKNGRRIVNGWKNSGAVWTEDVNPDLVYKP